MAKAASAKRKTSKKTVAKAKTLKNEIVAVILFAIALVLFLGIAGAGSGGVGKVGQVLTTFLKALAGKGAVIFPFFILFWGVVTFINRDAPPWNSRITGLLILAVSLIALFHTDVPLKTFSLYLNESLTGVGGGLIGGFISYLLKTAFGHWGALIILTAASIIGLLLLVRVSIWESGKKLGSWVKESAVKISPKSDPAPKEEELILPPVAEKPAAPIIINHDNSSLKPKAPVVEDAPLDAQRPNLEPPENKFSRHFMPIISGSELETVQSLDTPPVTAPDLPVYSGEALQAEPSQAASFEDEFIDDSDPFYFPDQEFTGTEDEEPNMAKIEEKLAAKARAKKAGLAVGENGLSNSGASFSPMNSNYYVLPSTDLLEALVKIKNPRMNKAITDAVDILEQTLKNFGVNAKVSQVVAGPAVTRYELQPAPGVKVSKITSLSDDIALSLAAPEVRIEAPIPGKAAVGIEVPRAEVATVYFRDVVESPAFEKSPSKISFALGKDITGEAIVGDLSKMPHLLIAGATGSGKSICVNSIICSILYKAKPDEVKFMLIDPKKVELAIYNKLPHLLTPVVTDNKKAAGCLKWAVKEMDDRYSLFAGNQVKDFKGYNDKHREALLPQIVVIIDELADLMMVAPADVEESICRLAQMARAAGIHLIVATQRPSVDVITGLIKANIPSRIAFAVSSHTDSRTILDASGADKLLGMGDMLYHPVGITKPVRVQGTFINEKEIARLVDYCHNQKPVVQFQSESDIESAASSVGVKKIEANGDYGDVLFFEAARLVIETGQASTSFLQRRFRIGNPRAARIMDILEEHGIVSGPDGAKPRNILISWDQFNEKFGEGA